MNVRNFYINETDSLLESIIEVFPEILSTEYFPSIKINVKKNNNNIGYMSFNHENSFINIIIFPKNIKIENNFCNKEQKEKYLLLLKNFLLLAQKYKKINLLDNKYNFSNNKQQSINEEFYDFFDSIIEKQYLIALENIDKFLKSHNPVFEEKYKFYDTTLKSKLDIKSNIVEVNKSKIHQITNKHFTTSELAEIIFSKLDYLLKFEQNRFSKYLKSKILLMKNNIQKKYFIDSSKYIHKNIFDYTLKRHFKNKELIFHSLLVLLGKENLFSNENNIDHQQENSQINFKTFFIDPKLIFEFFIYEFFSNKNEYSDVKLQRLNNEIKEEYNISKYQKSEHVKLVGRSEPDMRLENNNIYQLVDIKWKILKDGELPNIADLLKLKRDYDVSAQNNKDKKISKELILIYPKQENNEDYKLLLEFNDSIVYLIKFIEIY